MSSVVRQEGLDAPRGGTLQHLHFRRVLQHQGVAGKGEVVIGSANIVTQSTSGWGSTGSLNIGTSHSVAVEYDPHLPWQVGPQNFKMLMHCLTIPLCTYSFNCLINF